MEKVILDKTTAIEDNLVIITERTEKTLNREQLEQQYRNLQMQKSRIKEQNTRLVTEYNALLEEENEINELILRLDSNHSIEVI